MSKREVAVDINEVQLEELLAAVNSSSEIGSWLGRYFSQSIHDQTYWRLVGDSTSNAGAIEQSADPVNPLAERLVNSFESIIELNVQKKRIAYLCY